jgi:hypothetical protein
MALKRLVALASAAVLLSTIVLGEESATGPDPKTATLESVTSEIEALRPKDVAWRGIRWKTCLLEGLKESQEKGKPVLLWIFIDRPVDDARC